MPTAGSGSSAMGAAAGVLFHTADMVAEIIDFLPEQDLESCTGVSRLFRALAMARLHRYVCLPSPKSAAVLTREGLEEYATTIELEQHDHASCSRCADDRLDLKRLRTVILSPNYAEEQSEKAAEDSCRAPFGLGRYACTADGCVARGLAPKRLVVRPLGNAAGPSRRSVFHVPIAECDTIVHLNRSAEVQYYADPSPSTAPRHITVVLLPSFLGVFLSSTALGKGGVTGSKSSENEALIRTALAPYILANPQNSITIVGLDEANPFASAAHWSARQEHGAQEEMAFRDYLNRLMACAETVLPDGSRTAAWDDAARKHRQATIRVRTTREYFESGEWGPELDIAGSWLNCYYARFERDESEAAAAKAAAAAPRSGNYVIVPGSRPGHGHRYHNPTSTATTTFGIMTDMDMMRNFLMSTSNIHCVA